MDKYDYNPITNTIVKNSKTSVDFRRTRLKNTQAVDSSTKPILARTSNDLIGKLVKRESKRSSLIDTEKIVPGKVISYAQILPVK